MANGENLASSTARQIAQVEAIVNHTNPDWLLRLPLLGDLLDLPIPDNETTATFDPKLRQEALFALAVEIVQTWAQAQPLLLLVEDGHWLDEASQGLILTLGRVIANTPVLLALVQRPQDKPVLPDLHRLPYHHHLELHELTLSGVATLVTHRLKGQVSALALELVQTLAQGNPFFTEELVDALCETGDLYLQEDGTWTLSEPIFNTLRWANCLVKKDGQWVLAPEAPLAAIYLGIPDSIHGTVLSRIDRLPEGHKLTLKVASVIGRTFEFDLLAKSHPVHPGQETLLEHIKMMEARDLVRLERPQPPLTYMFKHNITQEAAYETLLEAHRRELHWAVGEGLESLLPGAVERLAYHYSHSGVRDKTLFYLDKAALKTRREYANETALNYYNQALALEERWQWRKGQVEVLHILGRRSKEEAALQLLKRAPQAPVFEVAYLAGQYHETVSNYAQAQTEIEQALEAVRNRGDMVGEVRCLAQLGLIARRQGDYDSAKGWYNQALALVRDEAAYSDEETQAFIEALNGLGTVHRQQGDFDQAKACYERALSLSRKSGNRRGETEALNSLGVIAFYQRHFAEAVSYYWQALEIRRAIGDRAGEGKSLYSLAMTTRDAGDYGQAQEHLFAALATLHATDNRWDEVNIWNDLGILYHELGDLPTAQTYLQRGLQLAQEIGAEVGQAYSKCNLGLVLRDQGNLIAAEQVLTDGLTLFQKENNKYEMSFFLSYLATVSLQAGRVEQAAEQAEAALAMRQELDMRLNTTDDLATLAMIHLRVGNMDQALDYAQQALTILEECGGQGPEFPQRAYFICYQVLAAARQEEAARVALQSAHNLVMGRAEKIADPTLRRSFLERVQINREIVQEAESAALLCH